MPKRSAQIGGFGCIDDAAPEACGGREDPDKLPRDARQIGIEHDQILCRRLAV